MKKKFQSIVIAALYFGSGLMLGNANATEDVVGRHVLAVGCHEVNGVCWATLDGPVFGANEGCQFSSSNQFRWDDADTANGRRTYASMLYAFASNKTVSVNVGGCSVQGYILIRYYNISN